MPVGPSQQAKNDFLTAIAEAVKGAYPKTEVTDEQIRLSIAKAKPEFGDLSSSISFGLAKQLKKPPSEIAKAIVARIAAKSLVSRFSEAGGYINASMNEERYTKAVLSAIYERKEFYGFNSAGKGKKVIVESPSVNPNKPWHIGHLRNALLGNVISNMLAASGYNVEREDYIDDLGLQVAESLWGITNLGNTPDKKYDQWLGEQYVLVNKRMETEKGVGEQIDALIHKMEDPRSKESRSARETAERCVTAQYETSFNYHISHDLLIWESDIVREKLLEKAIAAADAKGLLDRPKEGKYKDCVTIKLEKIKGAEKDFDNPMENMKVLIRSNGTATYVAKDFAFHMWKFGILEDTFKYGIFIEKQADGKQLYTSAGEGVSAIFGCADMVVNIIGEEQRYPQLILKAMFGLMGYKEKSENIIHLSYGSVGVEGESLSGRGGGWTGSEGRSYTADSLLSEVSKKALEIVEKSEKIGDKSKSGEIASAVALGAIKFEFLRMAPEKQVTFSWKKALDFESNSAPYCMYTYARSRRILEKAAYAPAELKDSDYTQVTRGTDFDLAKLLGEAQEVVEKAGGEYRPNILTDYLLDLSTLFSRFYEKMPVIKGGEAKDLRLALVSATMQVTKNMLLLLGIGVVESM